MSGGGSVVATYKPAVGTGTDGALFDDGFFNVVFTNVLHPGYETSGCNAFHAARSCGFI